MLLSRSIPKVYRASARQVAAQGAPRMNRMLVTSTPLSIDRTYLPKRAFSSSFLSGSNSVYVDSMYECWKNDPSSVHASWNAYFTNIAAGNI